MNAHLVSKIVQEINNPGNQLLINNTFRNPEFLIQRDGEIIIRVISDIPNNIQQVWIGDVNMLDRQRISNNADQQSLAIIVAACQYRACQDSTTQKASLYKALLARMETAERTAFKHLTR